MEPVYSVAYPSSTFRTFQACRIDEYSILVNNDLNLASYLSWVAPHSYFHFPFSPSRQLGGRLPDMSLRRECLDHTRGV